MTSLIILTAALLAIGGIISLVPRAIQEFVIIVTAVIGIVLLCTAPLMAYAVMFRNETLEQWLNDLGFFNLMVSGIIIVVVMGLFYQSWAQEQPDEDVDLN